MILHVTIIYSSFNCQNRFRLANLECKSESGQAKGADYFPGCFNPNSLSSGPGPHAWSAVKLQGEWFLSDATWAAGATSKI